MATVAYTSAATAVTVKPALNLMELHPDVLQNILRDVPLEDRMCILYKMPELRKLLEHCASYLVSRFPFLFEYFQYFNLLWTGWYVDSNIGAIASVYGSSPFHIIFL